MFRTREAWLKALTESLRAQFKDRAGLTIPPEVKVSCGWPSVKARSRKNRRIGECWVADAQVFVSPVLDDDMEVGQVLVHELIHACLPPDVGHRGAFVTAKNALDLGGKPTATTRTPELDAWLGPLVKDLGKYPHRKITPGPEQKKQSTRMKKFECPGCGFIARASRKWMDMYDANPTCPCGEEWIKA